MPKDVTRHISLPVQRMLWGKAAGRCEFAGCNQPLWKSPITQEQVNIAENAHIYSFSDEGPRGNDDIATEALNELPNLMLVCHQCHRKMDQERDGGRYSAQLLQQMKARHERRIEVVTGIDANRRSHVVLYGANIGDHSSPLSYRATASCLFPGRYPAEDNAIELGMVNSMLVDRDEGYWQVERRQLIRTFTSRVKGRLAAGEIEHLSVFALAPQPLLVLLGSLLTDIPQADVYQLRREPQGWGWDSDDGSAGLSLIEPDAVAGTPALILSLSATVREDRVSAVLGPGATLWRITVPEPHNDFLRTQSQVREFRQLIRRTLDRIKAGHGQSATLHVFPAMPVSLAVELGRVHMPKADLTLRIYDQQRERGFTPALDVPMEVHDD
jgi:predicted metal-binding protein